MCLFAYSSSDPFYHRLFELLCERIKIYIFDIICQVERKYIQIMKSPKISETHYIKITIYFHMFKNLELIAQASISELKHPEE
jgi:hypothetical protein